MANVPFGYTYQNYINLLMCCGSFDTIWSFYQLCCCFVCLKVCVLCGYGDGAMTLALQSHNIVKGLLDSWNFVPDSPSPKQNLSTDILDGKLNMSTSSSFELEGNSLLVSGPATNKYATAAKCKMGLQEQVDPVKSSACAPSNSLLYNSITAGVLDSTVKQWVHMVCGLWTPGTRCPNVNTMSAFDVSGACPKINVVRIAIYCLKE